MPRTIFIGDIHGCLTEFREMVEEKIRPALDDRIILLGDLINRGPDSVGVVKYVMEHGFECVMGNHEYRYSRKWEQPIWGCAEMRSVLNEEQHTWIKSLPLFIEDTGFITVHAGLLPGKNIEEILALPDGKKTMTQIRMISPEGQWSELNEYPGGTPWWQHYQGKKPLFYGHWASQGLALARNNTYGLDSGCLYGGFLSAYCLETQELWQVKSKSMYQKVGA